MKTPSLAFTALRFLGRLALPLSLCVAMGAGATNVDLADKPLFSTTSVPGNLLLDLSVEYPTANSAGYFSTSNYSNASTYLGYFDGAKCYTYIYQLDSKNNTGDLSYFQPAGLAASNHTCSAAGKQWSGNYLNYATMQGLDIFRWVLTGGNRTTDETGSTGKTILQRATHSGQGGAGDAPNKTLGSTDQATATPIPVGFGAGLNTRVWGAGIQLWFTNSADLSATTIPNCNSKNPSASPCTTDYQDANLSTLDGTKIYGLYINVRVCDSSSAAGTLEANCVSYPSSTYKPEGLMQQYSQTLRYGAFGYLNDSDINRDGGVLRARMAYIAPTQPVPGAPATTNAQPEWDPLTGVIYPNPDPSDFNDSSTYTGVTPSPAQSGVMNYLNKFGYSSGKYKTYDPVSELYYASIRYLKGLSNVSSYTTMSTASAANKATYVDGFPVISQWTVTPGDSYDPIVYSCQKNFILGIGDVNTHHDANLPGTTLPGQEPAMPPEVLADNTIDGGAGVAAATNVVGTMEGTNANLGSAYVADYATDYIAGLAYDAHVPISGHGLRTFTDTSTTPSTVTISTASTYWLDVQEYQTYVKNNQYYYTTKYGGFTVPNGYAYGTVPTLSSWYNSTNTQGGQKQPDNYYTASNATAMQAGLTAAFAKIAAENNGGNGTALSVPTPNVSANGSYSYSSTYDPVPWTGNVAGAKITFDTNGSPIIKPLWDAASLLDAATLLNPSPRNVITCCTASGGGLPFTYAALSSTSLDPRTNYASFANVPGVSNPTSPQTAETNYIAYLRGDTTQEIANGGLYRNRASRLGDIVDSKPVNVGAPSYQYYDTYNPGYATYKVAKASRKPVVYIGGNDGMLHAFDGLAGTELFAYIPSFTYGTASTAATSGLASLGNPNFTHHYLVDGTLDQFDLDFNKTSGVSGVPDWHTIIIGGLGKGGRGYYAIDVTDPASFSNETSAAGKVLWEFSDSRLGYTYTTPSVVKTKKYGWVVIFTSGYTNADGMGYFFFVNPKTGKLLEVVSTPAGSGTISAPLNVGVQSEYIENYADFTADAIYAGDLQGNVWRVDVSSANLTALYPTALKIAQFGSTQPITTRPLIEVPEQSSTRYLLVGTGKLLGDSDIQSGAQQAFYAIVDGTSTGGQFYGSPSNPLPAGVTFPIMPGALNNLTGLLLTGLKSNPTSAMGWYTNLPITDNIAERVNVNPTAAYGIVAFIGNTPNGSACSPNGTGEVYGINFATGKTVLVASDGVTLVASQPLPVPSGGGTSGVGTDITILGVGGNLGIYTGTSKGLTAKQNAIMTTSGGVVLINWRDVPTTN